MVSSRPRWTTRRSSRRAWHRVLTALRRAEELGAHEPRPARASTRSAKRRRRSPQLLGSTPFSHGRRSITFSGLMSRCTTQPRAGTRRRPGVRGERLPVAREQRSSPPRDRDRDRSPWPVRASPFDVHDLHLRVPARARRFSAARRERPARFGSPAPTPRTWRPASSRTRSADALRARPSRWISPRAPPRQSPAGDGEAPSGAALASRVDLAGWGWISGTPAARRGAADMPRPKHGAQHASSCRSVAPASASASSTSASALWSPARAAPAQARQAPRVHRARGLGERPFFYFR